MAPQKLIFLFMLIWLSPTLLSAQFVNGDFQTNALYGCTAGPNWTFDTDVTNLPELTDIFQPGNWWIDLTPCGDFGNGTWIEQNVITIPGACYSVTMDIASYCGWDGSDSGINLTADGMPVGDRIFNDVFSCIPGTLGWGTFTSEVFVATDNLTTLRFAGEGRCSEISDPSLCSPTGGVGNPGVIGLDNIVLNALTNEPLSVDQFPDEIRCPSESVVLGEPIDGANYIWSTGATTPQITVDSAGIYTVEINTSCTSLSDTIIVTDAKFPVPIDLGPDLFFCEDFTALLSSGTEPANWSTGALAASIVVNESGTYTATRTNSCGSVSDEIRIEREYVPSPSGIYEITLCDGQFAELTVPGSVAVWSTGETTSSISVSTGGTFSAVVSNECGSSTHTWEVLSEPCTFFFYAPNSYTPNGDGINDVWHPSIEGLFDEIKVSIWNRWGEEIWHTEEKDVNWTGQTRDGEYFAPDDVYHYVVVIYLPSLVKQIEGHIVLFR